MSLVHPVRSIRIARWLCVLATTLFVTGLGTVPARAQGGAVLSGPVAESLVGLDTLRIEQSTLLGVLPVGPRRLVRGSVVLSAPLARHVEASPVTLRHARRYDRLRRPAMVASRASSVLYLVLAANIVVADPFLGRDAGRAVAAGYIGATGIALWTVGAQHRALRKTVQAYNADVRR